MRKFYLLLSALFATLITIGQSAPVLPLDFESVTINYTFTDFDGGGTTKISNPQNNSDNASANVGRMIKSTGQPWGGSWISLASPIDFSVNKTFKVKVFMPRAGAKLLLKVENQADGGISFEKEATGTLANAWEELTFDYSTINTSNQYQKLVLIFDLGTVGNGTANFTYLFDDIRLVTVATPPPGGTQMNLPVTFDVAATEYGLVGFGGAEASTIITDPNLPSNNVAKVIKSATAELWAGTTITAVTGGIQTGFSSRIPFTASEKRMNVRVWSPNAGIKVRLKVEDFMDVTKSVETEATTTEANAWDTLTFDFGNQVAGTAAINLGYNYNKASIFFNFGVTGMDAGEKTYYFDDVKFGTNVITPPPSGTAPILPLDFESGTIDYSFTDFDGGGTTKIANPQNNGINTSANVGRMIKSAGQVWAGSWISMATPIDFTVDKIFKVKVFMPRVGAKLLLKVENQADGAVNFEREATGTIANAWEELTFDFSTINTSNQYQKITFIFDLGTAGDGSANFTYLFDDIILTSAAVPPTNPNQMNLPVTFDVAAIEYGLVGFGGAESSTIVTDPTQPGNTVAKVIKSATAELWAGTTITAVAGGIQTGFSTRIPFTAAEKRMNVRIWSPDAGIKIRLKVEDFMDVTKSVETEATTILANGWQTLTFDFGNQVTGTAAINLGFNYNKASIFFNFGVTGIVAGEKTYYFDDVKFGAAVTPPSTTAPVLPLDFESGTIVYAFTDFDGGGSTKIANPQTNGINTSANVGRMIKSAGQVWGGSWISMATPIDFSVNKTFKVKVFMPRVGAKLLLKVENQADGAVNFEREATGTTANAWEELSFDFSTINTSNQYQKLVLIFDLGTNGDGSANFTYLFDDIRLINAALPVKMTSFKAFVVNGNALVKWTTENEINNDHYEIERSNDGMHFATRGRVNGNGTSSATHVYEFTDQLTAVAPVVYYRLKIIDTDGKFTYSTIVALRINGALGIGNFTVYPNPFVSDIKVSLASQQNVMAGFRILSLEGKEILNRKMAIQQGDNIVVLKDFGVLPKGVYMLEVATPAGKTVKKIMSN